MKIPEAQIDYVRNGAEPPVLCYPAKAIHLELELQPTYTLRNVRDYLDPAGAMWVQPSVTRITTDHLDGVPYLIPQIQVTPLIFPHGVPDEITFTLILGYPFIASLIVWRFSTSVPGLAKLIRSAGLADGGR